MIEGFRPSLPSVPRSRFSGIASALTKRDGRFSGIGAALSRPRGLGDLSGVVEDIGGIAKPVMDKLEEVKAALKTSTYASLAAAGLCGLLFLTSLSSPRR